MNSLTLIEAILEVPCIYLYEPFCSGNISMNWHFCCGRGIYMLLLFGFSGLRNTVAIYSVNTMAIYCYLYILVE